MSKDAAKTKLKPAKGKPKLGGDSLNWVLLGCLLVGAFIAWCIWLGWGHRWVMNEILWHAKRETADVVRKADNPSVSDVMSRIGQSGDAFGGANALFAALAGAAVVWAGALQVQTLRKTREALEHEKAARKIEQFEAKFFRMLDLTRDLVARIEAKHFRTRSPAAHGDAALNAFALTIHRAMLHNQDIAQPSGLRELVSFYSRIYGNHPSELGAYFRLLFQTFKAISESGLELPEQIHYANIARGQISDGAVLLLALNGLTDHGRDFVFYIEKYGLLKHLLGKYRAAYKDEHLDLGYRERAYQGSTERPKTDPEEDPLPIDHIFNWTELDRIIWETQPIREAELQPIKQSPLMEDPAE